MRGGLWAVGPLCALGIAGVGIAGTLVGGSGALLGVSGPLPDIVSFEKREAAYRQNNLGVALLEQSRFADAAAAFRRALEVDPSLSMARVNLAVALYNVPDRDGALREAGAAADQAPSLPHPHYILGLVAKSQNRVEDAIAAFQHVLALAPSDIGASVNLGQLYLQQRRFDEAIAAFRSAVAAKPYNATATYNLGLTLTRAGQQEEGRRVLERFQKIREGGYGTQIGQTYPDQGRYAEAIASTGAEADLVDAGTPDVRFVDAGPIGKPQSGAALPAAGVGLGRITLFDFDGDGEPDLYEVGPGGQHLYRNEHGRFTDVTRALGFDPGRGGIGAVAGDYDNDGRPDLLVLRTDGVALYHNDGPRGFSEVTARAGIDSGSLVPGSVTPGAPVPGSVGAVSAAFVDADHDGDLDIFLGGFGNRLLRNNGNGTFTDVTARAGVAGPATPAEATRPAARTVAVAPTDFDNRRDVDLLVLYDGRPPALYRNMRDGTFRDVASEVGLTAAARFTSVAAADVNKDGFTDFFFGVADGPDLLASSDGKGRFVVSPAPGGTSGTTGAQFLDYDNDGLLDLITFSPGGARLFRNIGGGKWMEVTGAALSGVKQQAVTAFTPADIDGDGDLDLLVRLASGEVRLWRNDGGNRNHSLGVRLASRVSNRSSLGTKVEIRAGSLRQRLETSAATPPIAPPEILFGLGRRAAADAVRVLWPSGIVQAEIPAAPPTAGEQRPSPAPPRMLAITELDRKPSSCPFLYAWNGRGFAFVTDFMGGGEMGYWEGPGEWNQPVPEEYVRLRSEQLLPRDGRFEMRVTNELEEALFVDRLELIAVTHAADVEVFPNEGLTGAPRAPFKLWPARNLRPPRSAMDEHGHDVLARVARLDRRYPDDFRLLPIRGYAEPHALTLDLGDAAGPTLLLLTGWTDYAFSSDNVAAHQSGLQMQPPALDVEDAGGRWRTAIPNIGFPVGRPQTVVVDLTGRWMGPSRRVRITTNMRIYWDQILAADAADATEAALDLRSLEPTVAELRERGFSAETSPDGREPFGYDYDRVSWRARAPWKVMTGRYTRLGDVRELLRSSDDLYVISRPGDEIVLSFDARSLPPLREGWRRTYLLHADGFSKEMDINSASPDSVEPLPFHGMSRYPYAPPESYPLTPERRAILERYNTRVVNRPLAPLELAPLELVGELR